MTRRLFYIAMGATVGVLVVRRATAAAGRWTPAGVQDQLSGAVGGLGASVAQFLAEVREAMAEREAELRTGLGLDGGNDQIDALAYGPQTGR